jgi:hypothetical protein
MRKKLILSILALALVCGFAISLATPAIASWMNNSVVSITASAATTGITTTVVGVDTNAVQNPIDINGQLYAKSGGNAPNAITSFNSGPIVSGPTTLTSTASISAGGFVPGDYALFQVTITNNGPTVLQFGDYTVLSEFVDSSGTSIAYNAPAYENCPAFSAAANPAPVWNNQPISGFWNIASDQATQTTTFLTYINDEAVCGCANTWCGDNCLIGTGTAPTAPIVGQTLGNGATFVYYIYIGLGTYTAPGIANMLYTVTIPLTVAN